MNTPEGSDSMNNKKTVKMMEYLQKTTGIAHGILSYRSHLPWRYVLDEDQVSVLAGDHLIAYLVAYLDIKQLFGQEDLYNLVRPLLGYYFPVTDLESIDLDNPKSEIIYTKTELNDYIIVAKILNYPTLLIQKLETMWMSAPESLMEAENIQQQIIDARNKTLTLLNSFTSKK